MSRVAKNPVKLPAGVEVKFAGQQLSVKGAKGTLELNIHSSVEIVEEAGELLKYRWSIGGHSYDGHRLVEAGNNVKGPYYVTRMWLENERRSETDAEYKARVWSDISLDRVALKRAGVSEPVDFAFPYGAFNTDVVNMLNEAGYTYLYMDKPGLNRRGQDPSYICRITAGRSSHETMALLGWHFSQNR